MGGGGGFLHFVEDLQGFGDFSAFFFDLGLWGSLPFSAKPFPPDQELTFLLFRVLD